MSETIPVREKRYEPREAVCEQCGETYLKCAQNHRFCSDICRRTHLFGVRSCACCGQSFVPRARGSEPTRHCSQYCYIETQRQGGNGVG